MKWWVTGVAVGTLCHSLMAFGKEIDRILYGERRAMKKPSQPMPPASQPPGRTMSERRGANRYPLKLKLHYTCRPIEPSGLGETIDISGEHGGVSFITDQILPLLAKRIELIIAWLVVREGGPLELFVQGVVTRKERHGDRWLVGVRTERNELRPVRTGK